MLSSFRPGDGTLVSFEDEKMEKLIISGIACNRNEVKFTVSDIPRDSRIGAYIIERLSEFHIAIDMFVQNFQAGGNMELTFTAHFEDNKKILFLLREILAESQAAELSHDLDIAKISVIGLGMRSNARVINTIFSTLTRNHIAINCLIHQRLKFLCVSPRKI